MPRSIESSRSCWPIGLAMLTMLLAPQFPLAYGEGLSVRNGLVTLELLSRPGRELLDDLARLASFEARVIGDIGQVGPVSFQDVPLDEAIERLFKGHVRSVVIGYDRDQSGQLRVSRVRISMRAGIVRAAEPVSTEESDEASPTLVAETPANLRPPPPPTFLRLPRPPPPLNMFR